MKHFGGEMEFKMNCIIIYYIIIYLFEIMFKIVVNYVNT